MPDAVERTNRTDPRAADTDADGLTDARELNEVYSSPIEADSDGDGLSDGLEANDFGTSPLMVDTDGDQLSDDYEIVTDNRDPRIADMPAVTTCSVHRRISYGITIGKGPPRRTEHRGRRRVPRHQAHGRDSMKG